MEDILLNDILKLKDLNQVKIRLNLSNNKWNALELFHNDKDRLLTGNFHNSEKRRWFKENEIIIGLAQIKDDDWLLIDISRITKSYNNFFDGINHAKINTFYEHEKLEVYSKYFGRLIVRFHKDNAYVTLNGHRIDDFIVKEILSGTFNDDLFPGYENVNISWIDMKRLLQKDNWTTALQNQKGVYLISDTSNGKHYVGKASGAEMILGRWKSYVKTGHGDNVELRKLPFEHIQKNFRYSILEIFKSTIDDQIIIDRETWWKNVLLSRTFGYNQN